MPIQRLPLVGTPTDRDGTSTKDQRFYNWFPEALDKEDLFVQKRAGLVEEYANTAGEGRGIVTFNGSVYHFIDDVIYKDGSAIVDTLATTTGRLYFTIQGGASPQLTINDLTNLYTLNTSDTLTTGVDADRPTNMVAGLENLDQYTMVLDSIGIVSNSESETPLSFDANGFLTAETIADGGVRLIRHVNYIVALGEQTTEFFYNAANVTGSPFSRLEGTVSLIGCSAGATAVNIGQELVWVARDQGGSNFVCKVTGFTPEPISIKPVEEALDAAGSNVSGAYAYSIRIQGHSFYVLTIPHSSVAQTWVYDMTDKVWHQWTSFDGTTETYFTGIAATFHNGKVLVLDEDNGKVYHMSPTVYEDDGQIIKCRGITKRYDGGMDQNKFLPRLELISDRDVTSHGHLRIRWSDDDYVSFTHWREFDLSRSNTHITRLGKFKRRAFEYRFEENAPIRLHALEMYLKEGHYGM